MNARKNHPAHSFWVLISFLVFGVSQAAAKDANNHEFTLSLTNSSDDVNFNIASDLSGAETPNVLSDLRWDDLEIWQLEADTRFALGHHFRIQAGAKIGMINDGFVTDRDFMGDDKTDEFSRAIATADGKSSIEALVAIGWEVSTGFEIPTWRLGESNKRLAFASEISVTPKLGYSYTKQEIEFVDGIQIIPDLGAFSGLDSHYDPEWQGVFVGLDSEVRVAGKFYLIMAANYWFDLSFNASADWNLREDFSHRTSFTQDAEGSGTDYLAGLKWRINDQVSIGLSYQERDFSTDGGSDRTITAQEINIFTRLNKAEWMSRSLALSIEWRF